MCKGVCLAGLARHSHGVPLGNHWRLPDGNTRNSWRKKTTPRLQQIAFMYYYYYYFCHYAIFTIAPPLFTTHLHFSPRLSCGSHIHLSPYVHTYSNLHITFNIIQIYIFARLAFAKFSLRSIHQISIVCCVSVSKLKKVPSCHCPCRISSHRMLWASMVSNFIFIFSSSCFVRLPFRSHRRHRFVFTFLLRHFHLHPY